MIKVSFKFNKKELDKQVQKEVSKILVKTSEEIIEDLRLATPKDTGAASESWAKTDQKKLTFEITNDKDYVKYLNAGSSRQAPANFIERVALDYGTPKGPIVDYE